MTYCRDSTRLRCQIATALAAAVCAAVRVSSANDPGVNTLRVAQPSLTGAGVIVAQAEASTVYESPKGSKQYVSDNNFEVDPAAATVTAPITYINFTGQTSTVFGPPVGVKSEHATSVGSLFFGNAIGVAPGVAAVYNYEANRFYTLLYNDQPIQAKVVNQSFAFSDLEELDGLVIEQIYDNYVQQHGTIIVSGVGNGGDILRPASAYNSIAVGVYDGSSSVGPINGRSKPDIIATGGATSYSTPVVTGVATLLVQAGNNGFGGSTPAITTDPRTIKAILLNGAIKPIGWSYSPTSPLDNRFGAGFVNAYTSFLNLDAGIHAATASETTSVGGAHTAISSNAPLAAQGWNFKSLASSGSSDAFDHYVIDVSSAAPYAALTSTLTWLRPQNLGVANHTSTTVSGINNFDMYLYNADTHALIASSVSTVDNLEHLASILLTPGKYDLQVLKRGGAIGTSNVVSNADQYALAWNAATVTVNNNFITSSNGYLEIATSLSTPGLNADTVRINAGATLTSGPALVHALTINGIHSIQANAGTSAVDALTIAGTSNAWTGKLDLNNNLLILNTTTTSKSDAIATLSNQIAVAKSTGWNGAGITSTTAAADPLHKTVLAIDNALLGLTQFGGTSVDGFSVLIGATYFGDSNFDRKVDVSDLGVLASHYGSAVSTGVLGGDFNGDGLVDVSDLGVLATSYGLGTTTPFNLQADTALFPIFAATAIPEPASLTMFGLSSLLLLRRRRSSFAKRV